MGIRRLYGQIMRVCIIKWSEWSTADTQKQQMQDFNVIYDSHSLCTIDIFGNDS